MSGSNIVHVTPENDLKEHVTSGVRCHCEPRVEAVEGGGKVVVHNAYDGREFFEEPDDVTGH